MLDNVDNMENTRIVVKVETLEREVKELKARIKELEREIHEDREIVEPRTIPMDEARELILNYLKAHPNAYTSEILDDLNLEMELTLQTLDKLKKDGLIEQGVKDDAR